MSGLLRFFSKAQGLKVVNPPAEFFTSTVVMVDGKKKIVTPLQKAKDIAHDLNAYSFEFTHKQKIQKFKREFSKTNNKLVYRELLENED
jgi:hypothetical protein